MMWYVQEGKERVVHVLKVCTQDFGASILQYYCKALSLSARASPLRVLGFLRRSALRRWSRSVSRPYKDSYDSSARPMGVASQNSTLPCAIATFPVPLPLSSPGDVWPRLPLLPSMRP